MPSNADLAEGHLSAGLCYLGTIACQSGRPLEYDARAEPFPGDEEANRLSARDCRQPFALPGVL